MEAEWAEDEDVWLSQSLIASSIGTAKTVERTFRNLSPRLAMRANFTAGWILLKPETTTYSVLWSALTRSFCLGT